MAILITRKQSLLILIAGLFTSVFVVLALLSFETRLGFFYDFLLKKRPAPPVSGEIVLIETDSIAESGDIFDVLMAAGEFMASGVIIEVPVLDISSDRILTDDDIRQRLNDEYSLLGRNIRNLFDAIKMGSIGPAESQLYVDSLVDLSERGRDRLTAFLLRNSDSSSIPAFRPDIFPVLEAPDLRSNSPGKSSLFSQPGSDSDGIFRRIAPVRPLVYEGALRDDVISGTDNDGPGSSAPELAANHSDFWLDGARAFFAGIPSEIKNGYRLLKQAYIRSMLPPETDEKPAEHIVYRALKSRWLYTGMDFTEQGPVLIAGGSSFPLDSRGNIYIEKPGESGEFRTVTIGSIRAYSEADRSLRRLLKEAESAGIYSDLKPERIPLYLYDHAQALRDDFLDDPSPEKYGAWLHARGEYWNSLDGLLNSASVSELAGAYEEIITTENLNPVSLEKLRKLRNELIISFALLREKYLELAELRGSLDAALNSSLFIVGPPYAESQAVSSSALLANTLLTGHCISPGRKLPVILFSLVAVFVLLCVIHAMRPLLLLIVGSVSSLVCALGFSWNFVARAYWIDPLIPFLACFAGTLVMFSIAALIKRRMVRRFRAAYGGSVSKNCLKQLIRTG